MLLADEGPDDSVRLQKDPTEAYLASLGVFHELHCLVRTRTHTHKHTVTQKSRKTAPKPPDADFFYLFILAPHPLLPAQRPLLSHHHIRTAAVRREAYRSVFLPSPIPRLPPPPPTPPPPKTPPYLPQAFPAERKKKTPQDHCLETLRLSSMCSADIGLYTFRWPSHHDHSKKLATKSNSVRQCVDWDRLHEWAEGRSVGFNPVL